jgi:hypothetical protein
MGTCSSLWTAQHEKYKLNRNVVRAQMYVSEFRLDDYPVRGSGRCHLCRLAIGLRAVRRPAQRRTVLGTSGGLHDPDADRGSELPSNGWTWTSG